jgi:hypothetical protein
MSINNQDCCSEQGARGADDEEDLPAMLEKSFDSIVRGVEQRAAAEEEEENEEEEEEEEEEDHDCEERGGVREWGELRRGFVCCCRERGEPRKRTGVVADDGGDADDDDDDTKGEAWEVGGSVQKECCAITRSSNESAATLLQIRAKENALEKVEARHLEMGCRSRHDTLRPPKKYSRRLAGAQEEVHGHVWAGKRAEAEARCFQKRGGRKCRRRRG